MRHSTIQFGKNTVVKSAAPSLMRVEVEKARRAYEIGLYCGLFRVPEVLEYDEAKGIAVFERIEGIEPFRNIIFSANQYKPLVERIGASLAIIHQKLALPHEMNIALPPEFILPGSDVFLHGDFNGVNICVEQSLGSIVILDWQMTSVHGGQGTYGSRYFDLIWFVNHLLWTPSIRYLFGNPVAPVARTFIESYFKEAKIVYNAKEVTSYSKSFFRAKAPLRKQNASWKTRYLFPRSQALTKAFNELLQEISPNS